MFRQRKLSGEVVVWWYQSNRWAGRLARSNWRGIDRRALPPCSHTGHCQSTPDFQGNPL